MVETRSMAKKKALEQILQRKSKTTESKKVIKTTQQSNLKTALTSCAPSSSRKSSMPSNTDEKSSMKLNNPNNGGILSSAVSFIQEKFSRKPSPSAKNDCQTVVINYTCAICLCDFPSTEKSEYFEPNGCKHKTCLDCIRNYFKLAATDSTPLRKTYHSMQCPGLSCKGKLYAQDVLPRIFYNDVTEISKWWSKVLEKAFIKNKIICPFNGCRAVFDADMALSRKCTFAECLECNRGFCSACQDVWHHGVIKILDTENETMQTILAAEKNKWSRCPKCFKVVLKASGCHDIRCRCGTHFCYRCGGIMYAHNVCHNKCHLYSTQQLNNVRKKMFEKKTIDTPFSVAV